MKRFSNLIQNPLNQRILPPINGSDPQSTDNTIVATEEVPDYVHRVIVNNEVVELKVGYFVALQNDSSAYQICSIVKTNEKGVSHVEVRITDPFDATQEAFTIYLSDTSSPIPTDQIVAVGRSSQNIMSQLMAMHSNEEEEKPNQVEGGNLGPEFPVVVSKQPQLGATDKPNNHFPLDNFDDGFAEEDDYIEDLEAVFHHLAGDAEKFGYSEIDHDTYPTGLTPDRLLEFASVVAEQAQYQLEQSEVKGAPTRRRVMLLRKHAVALLLEAYCLNLIETR